MTLIATGVERQEAVGTAQECGLLDHEHTAWTTLLQGFVSDGVVDYEGWLRSGKQDLDAYLASLESVCQGAYGAWTRAQQLAFWMNAYNAYTVRLVLNHHPLDSIQDVGVLPGAPFREKFIPMRELRGGTISLNEIEHDVLRTEFREPRIHFAIVCASESCPALRSEAYRASELDAQLDDAARAFLRDATKNRYDTSDRTLLLSPIFDWFGEDFGGPVGGVLSFVAQYADEQTAAVIRGGDVRVRYLDYDWSLNGR